MAKAPSSRVRMPDADTDPAELDPSLPQKRRARHRLIGAIVLCAAAAVTVPMLLSPEPTRGGSTAQVVIEGREATPSSAQKPALAPMAAVQPAAPLPSSSPTGAPTAGAATESASSPASAATTAPAPVVMQPAPPETLVRAEAPAKSEPPRKDAAEARAPAKEAESRPAKGNAKGDAANRIVLQVGSFRQTASAQTALDRVKAAGLKGYNETVETERGERIRVRVGPFATRDAAEQARLKLKAAGLEAVVVNPQ